MTEPAALIDAALTGARAALSSAGDWLTGEQRRIAALEARDARTNPLDERRRHAISPTAVDGAHPAVGSLPATAVDVVHRIASDPGRLTRAWADGAIAELGPETYTELVGVTAMVSVVDTFAWALEPGEPPSLDAGDQEPPTRIRPSDVGDVGAWVAQSTALGNANVSRSLSLVPVTNRAWISLVQALYSRGAEFADLAWDRALTRPQVELVASRTTAELECFY